MRKRMRMLGFLLVPILLLAIVSCDLDTLSDFMGQTGTNVYAEGGLVKIDTSQGAAVVSSVGSLSDLDTTTDAGKTAYADEVETVKASIAEALTSPTKTETLIEELAKPLTSTVPTKVTTTVSTIESDLGIDIEDPTTEGDLVTLVLVVEVYEKAEELKSIIEKDPDTLTEDEKEQLIGLVSDAMQVVETVRTVSTAGSINLDSILENLIDDPDLLDQIMGRSSVSSRDIARAEEDDDDPMTFIEPIFNTIIDNIGTTGTGDSEVIITANLKRAITNFGIMRTAYETMAKGLAASGREVELSDVINYALSVIFTEADAFFTAYGGGITFEDAINDIIEWINDGKPEGVDPAFVTAIDDWEAKFDAFRTANTGKFGASTGTVVKTLKALAAAVPDGDFISNAIDDLFADSDA